MSVAKQAAAPCAEDASLRARAGRALAKGVPEAAAPQRSPHSRCPSQLPHKPGGGPATSRVRRRRQDTGTPSRTVCSSGRSATSASTSANESCARKSRRISAAPTRVQATHRAARLCRLVNGVVKAREPHVSDEWRYSTPHACDQPSPTLVESPYGEHDASGGRPRHETHKTKSGGRR